MDQNKDPRNLTMFGFQPNNKNDNASNDSSILVEEEEARENENIEEEQETKTNTITNANESATTNNVEANLRVLQPQLNSLTEKIKTLNQVETLIAEDFRRNLETNLEALPVSFYVSPLASSVTQGCRDADLVTAIHEKFVLDLKQRSLLILGEPGAGKTMLTQYLAYDYWLRYRGEKDYLPLYVRLPEIESSQRETYLLECYLQDHCGLRKHEAIQFKNRRQILLILDGFDELPQKSHLHKDNRWGKNIKVITTCRFEAMVKDQQLQKNYQAYFYPSGINTPIQADGVFQEWQLQPFNSAQIKLYLQHYVSQKMSPNAVRKNESSDNIDWSNWQTYEKYLQEIPGLSDLTAMPVILFFVCEALPAIVSELADKKNKKAEEDNENESKDEREIKTDDTDNEADKKKLLSSPQVKTLLRTDIYRLFIQQWFLSQVTRLEKRKELRILQASLEFYLQTYARNLAGVALAKGQGKLDNVISVEDTLNFNLLLPQHQEDERAKSQKALLTEDLKKLEQLSKNDSKIKDKIMQAMRSGCLLRTGHGSFSFMHKSLVEYLAAEDLFKDLSTFTSMLTQTGAQFELTLLPDYEQPSKRAGDNKKCNDSKSASKTLLKFNQQLLTQEPQILQMLADFVKKSSNFENLLFKLINLSKIQPLLAIAAANAITILKLAGVQLINRDFKGICIHGADLSGAILSNTNFEGADLSGVNFTHAWLEKVNFNKANLKNTVFGEQTPWEMKSRILSLAYSPDGELLMLGLETGVELWLLSESKCLFTSERYRDSVVRAILALEAPPDEYDSKIPIYGACSVAFSSDGKKFITGDWWHTVRLWDTKTFRCIITLKGHNESVLCVAFSPDNQQIVSCSRNWACVWDIKTYKCIMKIAMSYHLSSGQSVTFSPDGKKIALASLSGVELWDVETESYVRTFIKHKSIASFAYSHDGKRLASGGCDANVCLWNMENQRCLVILKGHKKAVSCLVFSCNSKWLASGSADSTIRLWDSDKYCCVAIIREHVGSIASIAFSPDGQRIASSNDNINRVFFSELSAYVSCSTLERSDMHGKVINCIVFLPNSKIAVLGGEDSKIRLWDVEVHQNAAILEGHKGGVNDIDCSLDSKMFVSASNDKTVRLWDTVTHCCVAVLEGHEKEVNCVTFSPDNQQIASGGRDNTIRVWNIKTHKCVAIVKEASSSARGVDSITFSPDGKIFASVSRWNGPYLWDSTNYNLINCLDTKKVGYSIVFSPDGRYLITGGAAGIFVWNMSGGLKHYLHRFYYKGEDNLRNALNLFLNTLTLKTLKGHKKGNVTYIRFSYDGKWFVSAGGEWLKPNGKICHNQKALCVWDSTALRCVAILEGHREKVTGIAFSRDGKWLISCDENGFLEWRIISYEPFVYYLAYSSYATPLNCRQLNLKQASGLSADQIKLLQHYGAEGIPSQASYVHPRSIQEQGDLKLINFHSIHAAIRKYCFSFIDNSLPVNYGNWVVSILRHDKSEYPQHAFLILEGLDAFGRGFLAKYHLVENRENKGKAKILYTLCQEFDLAAYQQTVDGNLLNYQKTCGLSFSIKREQGLVLHQAVITDQRQDINYATSGNRGLFSGTSNSSQKTHNCFTWAREKLYNLKEERINDKLPEKWTDFAVAVTSWYLPEQNPDQNNKNCLVM